MTKTNRFTLIATILLGILLYTILRYANDLNVAWDGSEKRPPPVTEELFPSTLPGIATATELRDWLDDPATGNDSDSTAILNDYANWSDARGFTGRNRLFGAPDDETSDTTMPDSEAALQTRSDAGDATASQALAEQRLFTDLFGAIELFTRAAEQGSTFALLRLGSLLEAFDAAGTDPEQRRHALELAGRGGGHNLRITAFGYVVTAIRDGGLPIVDRSLLAWLDRLHDETTNDEQIEVCAWSERTLLEIARNRVRWGKPAISTVTPPVFFAIPDLDDRLPCNKTAFPIDNLLDLTHCTITQVRDATDKPLDLYLCPSDYL